MEKQKMSIEKKTKLIYSGELLIFAILFLVLATLEVLAVIGKREIMMIIFNWVTMFGGSWMIADFIWLMCSKKRQKKNSIIDKALLVPLGIYLITFDIICFCQLSFVDMAFRRLMMGIAFYYMGANYLFQAIYHWFKPVPSLLEAIQEEEEKEVIEVTTEEVSEEMPSEENKEENEKPEE